MSGLRVPWGGFPDLLSNGGLGSLSDHPAYRLAKAGDRQAAVQLVGDVLTDGFVESFQRSLGGVRPILVPVLAKESGGRNKIPLAFGRALSVRLGLPLETEIVQSVYVGRTNSNSDHRLVYSPEFEGPVAEGAPYAILDDTATMGGTLAALRGHIEQGGGKVIGGAVLSAHEGALRLPIAPQMLADIFDRHGRAMNDLWQQEFGYGIECLTQGEGGHIRAAASVEQMRNRISEARNAFGRGVDGKPVPRALPVQATDPTTIAELSDNDIAARYKESLQKAERFKRDQARRVRSRLRVKLPAATKDVQEKLKSRERFVDALVRTPQGGRTLNMMAVSLVSRHDPGLSNAMAGVRKRRRSNHEVQKEAKRIRRLKPRKH